MCRCYLQKVRVIGRKSSGLSERKKERLSDKEKSKLYHAHILRWDDSRYLKTEGLRGCFFFAGATIMMACVGLALKVSTRIVTSKELVILALAMHFTPFPPIC